MSNQNLYGQSFEQIMSNIIGGGSKKFQMLNKPQSFNWSPAPSGQIAPAAYQFMSAAPAYSPVGQFDGVGVSTLFDNYRQVFSHVGFEDSPELTRQLKELSDKATTLRNDITANYGAMDNAYIVAKQNGGVSFSSLYPDVKAWLDNSPDAKSYKDKATDLGTQLEAITNNALALTIANQPTELKDSLDAMKRPDSTETGFPRGWIKVANGAGVLEWQPDFTISTDSSSWRAQLTSGSIGKTSITLSASKSSSAISSSWAGGSASYDRGFWGVYVNGSWSETNFSESDASVTATVNLESSTVVNITPGAWYNGGFLRQLATAGNTGTGYQILAPYTASSGQQSLFGKGGLCPTMVTGLVVASKPSFSLTMKTSTYQSFEQQIEASAGLRIGPFNFGGSGGHYTKNTSATGDTTTITGGSTSADPVIIGVMVGFPGMPEGGPENALVGIPTSVEEVDMFNLVDDKGLDIFSDGKIQISANGKYHFQVMERV